MTSRRRLGWAASAVVLLLLAPACAPARVSLPTGPGEPLPAAERDAIAEQAFSTCAGVQTLTAELGLSGRAGRQRLRGRLIAGIAAPGSIRLEGVAPFGPPVFILAASPGRSTLLLPRDDRVLFDAEPGEILEALAGLALGPDDLLSVLAGCPSREPVVRRGRRHGDAWTAFELGDGSEAYVRRLAGTWRLIALVRPALTIEYAELEGSRPALVRLVSRATGPAAFDLRVRLSQVELNAEVPEAAFRVTVPPEARPISLDELRDAGPMRDASGETAAR